MKKVLVSLIAACLLLSTVFVVKTLIRDVHQELLLEPMVEALSQAEFGNTGSGPCYQSLGFCLTILYLDCNSCRYWYGKPMSEPAGACV